jgi:methylmalonyl-CoA mutase N-terminal domain/subunit
MRDRFGSQNPRAQQLRFHAQTAGSTLTSKQPDNNIVRVALQAMAAVLGGTQSLHCNGRDEALALPTEESARVALRTQQIVAYETGAVNTIDPTAGAYAFEAKTNEIEEGARDLLDQIDRMGGTLSAIETGFIQRQIQDSAYRAQQAIDSGAAVVVGVNQHETDEPGRIDLLRIDARLEAQQAARTRSFRTSRNDAECRAALAAVARAARGADNLVPPVIAAVDAHATLGEIADAMRQVFGEHREADAGA